MKFDGAWLREKSASWPKYVAPPLLQAEEVFYGAFHSVPRRDSDYHDKLKRRALAFVDMGESLREPSKYLAK